MRRVDGLAHTQLRAIPSDPPPVSGVSGLEPVAPSLIDGRYRVLGRLAQGGMGIVYRAEDVLLQRPAALKVIDPSLARVSESLDLLRREARALARLRHDNVVQIYAFGAAGASYYFAMELIEGKNLDDILMAHVEAKTSMRLEAALAIVQKIASGLTAAHARAVTHRDVKPSNIVIEHETGRPVLVDFGIARQAKDTHADHTSGTPAYMAPEQIQNVMDHDGARADLYSLACTAFEMLGGRAPFTGDTPYELMRAHVETSPPLLSSLRPEYEPLDRVFARALAKSPQYRHESCLEFANDLSEKSKLIIKTNIREATDARERTISTESPPQTSRTRVLVFAQDDGVRRSVVREATRSLRKVGVEDARIDCVGDAPALFQEVTKHRPEIVVLDDDAARGASVALAGALRRLEGGDRMHIVVLTRDMLAERSVWQAVNAKRLSKPLSPRALASTLDDLVLTLP